MDLNELILKKVLKKGPIEVALAAIVFIASWIAIILKYENFILSFGLGWIPSAFFAILVVFAWQLRIYFLGAFLFLLVLLNFSNPGGK